MTYDSFCTYDKNFNGEFEGFIEFNSLDCGYFGRCQIRRGAILLLNSRHTQTSAVGQGKEFFVTLNFSIEGCLEVISAIVH